MACAGCRELVRGPLPVTTAGVNNPEESCRLRPEEEAVVVREEVSARLTGREAEVTTVSVLRFSPGAMGGAPSFAFHHHPVRGEDLSLDSVKTQPDGRPVYSVADVPPPLATLAQDPDRRSLKVTIVMPEGGMATLTTTRTIRALPSLPGFAATLAGTSPLRRCQVSVTVRHPAELPVLLWPAPLSRRDQQRDGERTVHLEYRDLPAASGADDDLLTVSTLRSWDDMARALWTGYGLDDVQIAPTATAQAPAKLVGELASRVRPCIRRASSADDTVFPQDMATLAAWGCGPCRDVSAYAAHALLRAGTPAWLVFTDPRTPLDPEFPTDRLPHVLVAWDLDQPSPQFLDLTTGVSPGPGVSAMFAGDRAFAVGSGQGGTVGRFITLPRTAVRQKPSLGGDPAAELEDTLVALPDGGLTLHREMAARCLNDSPCHVAQLMTGDLRLMAATLTGTNGTLSAPSAYLLPCAEGPGLAAPRRGLVVSLAGRPGDTLRLTMDITGLPPLFGLLPPPEDALVDRWRVARPGGFDLELPGAAPPVVSVPLEAAGRTIVAVYAPPPKNGVVGYHHTGPVGNLLLSLIRALDEVTPSTADPGDDDLTAAFASTFTSPAPGHTDPRESLLVRGDPWPWLHRMATRHPSTMIGLLVPPAGQDGPGLRRATPVMVSLEDDGLSVSQPFSPCPGMAPGRESGGDLYAVDPRLPQRVQRFTLTAQPMSAGELSLGYELTISPSGQVQGEAKLSATDAAACLVRQVRRMTDLPPAFVRASHQPGQFTARWPVHFQLQPGPGDTYVVSLGLRPADYLTLPTGLRLSVSVDLTLEDGLEQQDRDVHRREDDGRALWVNARGRQAHCTTNWRPETTPETTQWIACTLEAYARAQTAGE